MFRKDKNLFITLILMLVIVSSLILVAWLYEGRSQEYENLIEDKNKSFNSMSKSYTEILKENEILLNKIEELKEENEKIKEDRTFSSEGEFATYQQNLINLSDISLLIKEGKVKEAKEELLKINTNGFDQSLISFYESLCRELDIKY